MITTAGETATVIVILYSYKLCANLHAFVSCVGSPRDPPSVNISLVDEAYLYFEYGYIYIYDCPEVELRWEILRADGETELYSVVNETYRYGRYERYPDRGLRISGYCDHYCDADLWISPTDLRYDGAQITAILSLPGCSDSPYSSDAMTLHIQGQVGI